MYVCVCVCAICHHVCMCLRVYLFNAYKILHVVQVFRRGSEGDIPLTSKEFWNLKNLPPPIHVHTVKGRLESGLNLCVYMCVCVCHR
jgi:hypothetical protein